MMDRVGTAASQLGIGHHLCQDVGSDEKFRRIRAPEIPLDGFDICVHAVAFRTREALTGQLSFDATTREGFAWPTIFQVTVSRRVARASLPSLQGRSWFDSIHLELPGAIRSIPG